jgi:hypothetical protein
MPKILSVFSTFLKSALQRSTLSVMRFIRLLWLTWMQQFKKEEKNKKYFPAWKSQEPILRSWVTYNATSCLVRFKNKNNIFFYVFKRTMYVVLVQQRCGVVVVNSEVVGLVPGAKTLEPCPTAWRSGHRNRLRNRMPGFEPARVWSCWGKHCYAAVYVFLTWYALFVCSNERQRHWPEKCKKMRRST